MSTVIDDERTLRNIASNVRRLLRSREWTQNQLAAASGEPQPTISRLANGLHMPGVYTLAKVAEAFDVTIDRLLMDPPEEIPEETSKSA